MDKVATFLQQEKGLDLKEHMVEIEEMAQLNNGGYRQVTSFLLSRTACVAIAMNADKKKPITKVAQDYFTQKMDWKTLLERYLQISDRDILPDSGSVSHEEAEAKALGEYEKFWRIQDKTILSDFDRFIEDLK